jgi:hypothetical protein
VRNKEVLLLRRLFVLLTAGLLVLGVAGVASAAQLNWSGTLTIDLGDFPSEPVRMGGVATINMSSGGIPAHLNAMRFKASRHALRDGSFFIPITDPEGDPAIAALSFIGITLGSGSFKGISGAVSSESLLSRNVLPVMGLVKVCGSLACGPDSLPLLLTQPGDTVNGTVISRRGVGIGGLITIGGGGPIRISIEAAPWTVKTVTLIDQIETVTANGAEIEIFVNVTTKGFAHGPASNQTTTAAVSGVVQFVTPAQIVTNLTAPTAEKLATRVRLLVHFIPEPGLLLLLGSGVAGLAILGRKRMRS